MDEVRDFLKERGWVILSIEENLVTLHVLPTEIMRAAHRLRQSLFDVGVQLYPARMPFVTPCAWVEYDVFAVQAKLYLAISDEWMPRGRACAARTAAH